MSGKTCSLGADGAINTAPNMLPRAEKSDVRDSIKYAMNSMTKQRKLAPNKLTEAQRIAAQKGQSPATVAAKAAPSKGAQQFDAAMQNPALKNLGL